VRPARIGGELRKQALCVGPNRHLEQRLHLALKLEIRAACLAQEGRARRAIELDDLLEQRLHPAISIELGGGWPSRHVQP